MYFLRNPRRDSRLILWAKGEFWAKGIISQKLSGFLLPASCQTPILASGPDNFRHVSGSMCVCVCVCVEAHMCGLECWQDLVWRYSRCWFGFDLEPFRSSSWTSPLVWSLCAPGWCCSTSGPSLWGFAFIPMICRKKDVCPAFSTERWRTHGPSTGIVPLSRLSRSDKLWKLKAFWQLLPGLNIFGSKTWCEL